MMAKGLIAEKYAVCVNIIPQIISIYQWQGEMCEEEEVTLFIKTLFERRDKAVNYIKQNHSYEAPNIAVWRFDQDSAPYLSWMKQQLDEA